MTTRRNDGSRRNSLDIHPKRTKAEAFGPRITPRLMLLPDEMFDRLQTYATETDQSVQTVVRSAIGAWLDQVAARGEE